MKKWFVLLVVPMLFATGALADWKSVDTWDMNGNATWQHSDNGLNLGGHYSSNNQQVAQIPDDGTFIFSPVTAGSFGGKPALSSAADLTEGLVRLSWTLTSVNWSNTPAANNAVGLRLWNSTESEYIGLGFFDSADKVFARIQSSAGLGNLGGSGTNRAQVISSLSNMVTRTITIELDYANGEVRMSNSGNWTYNPNGSNTDAVTNAVDFAAAGVTNIARFQTYYQNWGAGDTITFDNLAVEKFVIPPEEEVLEEWIYTGASNGIALNAGTNVLSETGTGSHWGSGAMATVSNEMQYFEATGVADESYFKTAAHGSYEDASNGLYQMSFDVVSADFSLTAASNKTAQVGYGIRSKVGGNKDARVLFRYNGSTVNDRFDLTITSDTGNKSVANYLAGHVLGENLHIRMVYDIDNKGSLGSYQVFTTLGTDAEVEQYAGQLQLEANFQIDELRLQAQALNGGNGWLPGDGVFVDNIVLAKLNPPEVIHTNVYIVDQKSFSAPNAATTNTTTLNVLAGDVIALTTASNQGTDPSTNSVTFSGTASLDSVSYDKRSAGALASYWTTTALTDGDVDVELITIDAYTKGEVYQLRAPAGQEVVLLDTGKTGGADVESVTNNYALGEVSSGILLEAVSTYGENSTSLNPDTDLDSGDGNKRNSSHTPFLDVSSIESIWTNSVGNTAIIGLAYSSAPTNAPLEGYALWADEKGLTPGVNDGLEDDAEAGGGDGLNNLQEYAFDGDPLGDDAATVGPQASEDGTWFYHVHKERTDDASLTFTVELDANASLPMASWGTAGLEAETRGAVDPGFDMVTNSTSSAGAQEFIKLTVEKD